MSKDSRLASIHKHIADESFMSVIVFSINSGEPVFINQAAKDTLELEPRTLNVTIEQLCPKEERKGYTSLTKDLFQMQGFHQRLLMQKPKGHIFIADLGIKTISVEDTSYHLLMFRDVTFQAKLQRDILHKQRELQNAFSELKDQNIALKSLDQAKDRFIALTTHELKTPLSAMISTAEVLKMGLYDNKEQMNEFIATIYTEGMHLLAIVEDILDFSKIQAGKMDFYIEKSQIKDTIREHFKSFSNMADEKNVRLLMDDKDSETLSYFDDLRMKQVTANIINNAIKFTKTNSTVRVTFKNDKSNFTVWFHDEGSGIKEEHRNRVFNEFETVGNVNSHHKGTGLGMPISKRLMEKMGGEIGFKTEVGRGTSFFIKIPKTKVLPEENYRPRPDFAQEVA